MIIRRPPDIPSSEITPESVYFNRRKFIRAAGLAAVGAAGLAAVGPAVAGAEDGPQEIPERFRDMRSEQGERLNSYRDITTYNNFYEFGTAKGDPAENSDAFRPRPWTVRISGHVNKPGDMPLDDLLAPHRMEDRVYRLRCVEAWSMVIPWRGFPLADLIRRVEPTGNARFVKFTTVYRPEEMPGLRAPILDWPYVEGLRMDEAMHPLTLLVTGVYGLDLPNQNGAPLRLIVPWKYGFKGIKSIVSIEFVEEMPLNSWQQYNSTEYGFYANVNPNVDHPRWSQARERRLPSLFQNRPTQMFNGYADQVAHLYAGMDLRRWK
ncbi:MAG TPA: protein-methionine-sulfoxide reductase catalytic subunit MsrP [Longimicrobiales bacterium]|nr:protein-methionine-sulfoxide reductase catalytic subunit MsrP [Longimicrobiales bacterium]